LKVKPSQSALVGGRGCAVRRKPEIRLAQMHVLASLALLLIFAAGVLVDALQQPGISLFPLVNHQPLQHTLPKRSCPSRGTHLAFWWDAR